MAVSAASERLGVRALRALVKEDNAPSLAAFAAAGFRVVGENDTGVVELLHGPDVGASPG
jgi:L-amino acid N-acyltransferase YncA